MSEHVYRPQSSQSPSHSPSAASPGISHVAPLGAPIAHPPAEAPVSKIHGFSGAKVGDSGESKWKRSLNKDGSGATHVRTFIGGRVLR